MNLRETLKNIKAEYGLIANADPNSLREKIPSKEVWRFFIDGKDQLTGRGLKLSDIFKPPSYYQRFLYKNPLSYTVKDYIEKVEKVNYSNEEERKKSKLYQLLLDSKWSLNDEEIKSLTLFDLLHMDKAWIPYERSEPGYLKALFNGFNSIFSLNIPPSKEFIKNLHNIALNKVDDTSYEEAPETIGAFRVNTLATFGLTTSNSSHMGLYELLEKNHKEFINTGACNSFLSLCFGNERCLMIDGKFLDFVIQNSQRSYNDEELFNACHEFIEGSDDNEKLINFKYVSPTIKSLLEAKDIKSINDVLFNIVKNNKNGYKLEFTNIQTDDELEDSMQNLIGKYTTDIQQAKDDLSKLVVIIDFVQSCEQLHPFVDGNCRVFCMLLLNHLLLENNFPPAILDNPNRFDMFSKAELLEDVLQGMQNTLKLIKTGTLFNINTDTILYYLKSKDYLLSYSHLFNELISQEDLARWHPVIHLG